MITNQYLWYPFIIQFLPQLIRNPLPTQGAKSYEAPTRCWSCASPSRKRTGHGHSSEVRTTRCRTLIFGSDTVFFLGVDLTVVLAVAENRVIKERKHNINLIIVILFNQFILISRILKNSLSSHHHHLTSFSI